MKKKKTKTLEDELKEAIGSLSKFPQPGENMKFILSDGPYEGTYLGRAGGCMYLKDAKKVGTTNLPYKYMQVVTDNIDAWYTFEEKKKK